MILWLACSSQRKQRLLLERKCRPLIENPRNAWNISLYISLHRASRTRDERVKASWLDTLIQTSFILPTWSHAKIILHAVCKTRAPTYIIQTSRAIITSRQSSTFYIPIDAHIPAPENVSRASSRVEIRSERVDSISRSRPRLHFRAAISWWRAMKLPSGKCQRICPPLRITTMTIAPYPSRKFGSPRSP